MISKTTSMKLEDKICVRDLTLTEILLLLLDEVMKLGILMETPHICFKEVEMVNLIFFKILFIYF